MELTVRINDKDIYNSLTQFLKALHIEIVREEHDEEIKEREEWYKFAAANLARAYSDDEPEYTLDMIKEPNPEYEPS